MNRLIRTFLTAACLVVVPTALHAQVTLLEFHQSDTPFNYQTTNGVPISTTVNASIGSNGRMTNWNESTYSPFPQGLFPTNNQFRSVVSFGGGFGLTNGAWQVVSNSALLRGTNAFSKEVAVAMGLPLGYNINGQLNSGIAIIQRQGQIGVPYLSRQVSFPFGQVIQVPDTDENGKLLTNIVAASYWLPEPFSTTGHANAGYYWSPNAKKVYASQPGQMNIRWVKAAYTNGQPADFKILSTNIVAGISTNYTYNYASNSGNFFRIYDVPYVVSGSPVKPPRHVYWTEKGFRTLGKPIAIPSARIGGVSIAYNNLFPRTVAATNVYVGPGDTSPVDGSTNAVLLEQRTLWYDQQQGGIFAYNKEGRVFMELLGDFHDDGVTREQLGVEIVDVEKNESPIDVQTELGEIILPPPPGTRDTLTPEPILQGVGTTFAYQQFLQGSGRLNLYATRETLNQNDYLVHWMEEGEVGLKWPKLLGRYQMIWPTDVARYSHYVRPRVVTEAEAKATAVVLPAANAPTIEYQDPLDVARGKLTETFGYYTFLDIAHPAHRALLRFSAGEEVAFERVFSWLDVNLKSPSSTNFLGTVATNLTSVSNFLNYPSALAKYNTYLTNLPAYNSYTNYTNYLAKRNRGVNGSWLCFVGYNGVSGPAGTIGSWSLVVESQGAGGSPLFTNEFAGSGFTFPANSFNNTVVNVTGITNAVTFMRLKVNGVNNANPANMFLQFNGPRSSIAPMYSNLSNAAVNANLIFDDRAAAVVTSVISGTYLSKSGALDALLLPAVTEVTAPAQPFVTALPAVVLPPIPYLVPFPANEFIAPRVVSLPAYVGDRLNAPSGEPGETGNYLAGHINLSAGILFSANAYLDPLTRGFTLANLGGIIPVNAVPGFNNLEVWWFRTNAPTAGTNAANAEKGFLPVYWPSVLARYTIEWPSSPREIVLASKLGSGTIDQFEASGTIYSQKNPALPGYNPNEEHAIIDGGIAYATRDDLNITTASGYSSEPFVLVQYYDPVGRPAMSTFKVLREKPSAGWVFDYITEAGKLLQAPMPLPLLAPPVEGSGDNAVSYNTEPTGDGGDLPGNWSAAQSAGLYGHYDKFTYKDRKNAFWVYRGMHAGLPSLQAGRYVLTNQTFVPITAATSIVDRAFSMSVHASRQDEFLALSSPDAPSWLNISGLTLSGTPTTNDVGNTTIQLIVRDLYDQSSVTNTLSLQVRTNGTVNTQGPLIISCTNSFTGTIINFSNRPPFLATSPAPSNSFTMRYYYRTEPSFDWPGVSSPPPAGSIVPYLRPLTNGVFTGDAASKNTKALEIVYRPVWPVRDPKDSSKPLATIPYGLTLANPGAGGLPLPGIRDWKTARVIYQQSVASDINTARPSVVLHDPTREKTASITNFGMQELPAGVRQESYQGKIFFPNLPPHLAKRLFFDPTRKALVLIGEFKDETVGEDYLLLNLLRGSDLTDAFGLCPSSDVVNYPKWTNTIAGLTTAIETFYENPSVPGTYIPNPNLTTSSGVTNLAEVSSDNVAVVSYALSATGPGSGFVTLVEAGGTAFTQPGDPVALHVFKMSPSLHPGQLKVIFSDNPLAEQVSFQHTPDLAGRFDEYEYQWKIAAPVEGLPPDIDATMSRYLALQPPGINQSRYTLGGSGIRVLGDNYIVMRYRPIDSAHALYTTAAGDANATNWSEWTIPQLAEGWIKRVLGGINPFNQRTKDLFNNAANTDASILTSAGHRWEGDVALNLDSINNYGLIEIYETVLRRGRSISIESGYNVGNANDALLLAAGYLSDLYMMTGNEAWSDAANPTIGIGTADRTYGDIATALFAFKGQVPSLLEEELALLRGRDDFLQPGVTFAPFYNRLVWNYTRGIDAGEVIYALNYNIQENPNQTPDGVINAADAARVFPMGHGDAYGHYLTALKGYYSLLLNNNFDWVPRIEAVTVLGVPVSVDYQDERKFAAAAAAVGRAGRQIFDLTWRKDYQPGHAYGWSHFSPTRENDQRTYTNTVGTAVHPIRYWGLDHWSSRTGQGNYLHWVVGNSMLPDVDPDTTHEGIQKIDRTTVPELTELATMAMDLQTAMDNAEGGLTPLGLPQDSVALDINPNVVVGPDNGTHFEQIYGRAKTSLQNAVAAFDDAKDVTRLMRSEQDSLAGVQAAVAQQELAYTNALIELYGTPYADDIGAGKTYKQGFEGPDLLHYMYMDDLTFGTNNGMWNPNGVATGEEVFKIDIQTLPEDWGSTLSINNWLVQASSPNYSNGVHYIEYNWGPHGFLDKPSTWTGQRRSPGKIQEAISRIIAAHDKLYEELTANSISDKEDLDKALQLFDSKGISLTAIRGLESKTRISKTESIEQGSAFQITSSDLDTSVEIANGIREVISTSLPNSLVFGLANGGDLLSPARGAIYGTASVVQALLLAAKGIYTRVYLSSESDRQKDLLELQRQIDELGRTEELKDAVVQLGAALKQLQGRYIGINSAIRNLADATSAYQALVAQGDRLQTERMVARQRTAAVVQGYRTRDAAFRIFRNEKLERYKTLFDLSARYSLLAANAYDYETGLLNTDAGRGFINRILSARALGVVRNGEPQFAGSNTGDPGLSSALAEMKADWDGVKGRLGFNNPDAYGTTVSLRTENFRILPGTNSNVNWQNLLQQNRKRDLLQDEDVRRHCLQISRGDGLPVPGIVIEFSTTIANGYNFFGQELAAGDHAFSPSSFATKIFGVGASLEGYRGMDQPAANGGAGGTSPTDPNTWFLDPLALSATPYVYLIPVGADSMRSPPLGDANAIRSWSVDDVAIPLPFNIGASTLSSGGYYQSANSLSEPLFAIRKHQAFRPVPSASFFSTSLYGSGGSLLRSQYTNNRLIGRSAWNSRWKLVIPGHTLLNDPDEGLERLIKTLTDVKLHFVTYSYSGN